jgi:hypothetical protein
MFSLTFLCLYATNLHKNYSGTISTFPDLKLRVSATNTSGAKPFCQLAILSKRHFVNSQNYVQKNEPNLGLKGSFKLRQKML